MNLVMPLADNSPLGQARLIQTLGGAVEEVIAGLDNTQLVHFGRFTIVDGNLCMFSIYDGDFSNYIRDFIYNVGAAFDGLLSLVKDPPPLPVEEHPDEFIDWVMERDALQVVVPRHRPAARPRRRPRPGEGHPAARAAPRRVPAIRSPAQRPALRVPRLPRVLGGADPRQVQDRLVSAMESMGQPATEPSALPSGIGIDDPDGTILADIQGNILRGYNMRFVRHLVVRVAGRRRRPRVPPGRRHRRRRHADRSPPPSRGTTGPSRPPASTSA